MSSNAKSSTSTETVVQRSGDAVIADVGDVSLAGRSGVVWALDSSQLNANFVKLDAGTDMPEHTNDEVDVLLVVQGGNGTVTIDDEVYAVAADTVVLVPAGARRTISAQRRLLYFSIHVRRGALNVNTGNDAARSA